MPFPVISRVLRRGRIDVWFANIDLLASSKEEFEPLLSPEEATRAERFRFLGDRNRYVVQHGVLRKLLAGYAGCGPEQVDIRAAHNGKPYLAGHGSRAAIQYSLSHSEDFAVYAFGLVDRIGVDIERIRQFPDMLEIVEQQFTPREKHEVLQCPEEGRLELFYRFWTRKEAVLKAQGDGLLKALDSVDVAVNNGGRPSSWRVRVPMETGEEEYSVLDLESPAGFAAAVAAESDSAGISVHYPVMDAWAKALCEPACARQVPVD